MTTWERQIESDLVWRERELASLHLAALLADNNTSLQKSLLRSLWTMLYAHYEGFFKVVWETYITHVETASIRRCDATDAIAKLSFQESGGTLGRCVNRKL
jgi:hypothetical protein